MRILIEGPDGCGKSTLAKKMKKVFYDETGERLKYHHVTKDDHTEEGIKKLFKLVSKSEDIVVDRGFLTNIVYGTVFNEEILDAETLTKYRSLFDVVIFCIPQDKEAYLAHFEKLKGEREELYSQMGKVYDLFNYFSILCMTEYSEGSYFRYDFMEPWEGDEDADWDNARELAANILFG